MCSGYAMGGRKLSFEQGEEGSCEERKLEKSKRTH